MPKYITDEHAVNGVINLDVIDLDGYKGDITSDRHIGVMIRAPRSIVKIGALNVENFYKGVEIREAKACFIDEFTALNCWNDSMQITTNNVYIKSYTSASMIKKEYSDSNHPDHLQLWSINGGTLKNIIIDEFIAITQNFDKQGVIHLTEVNKYENIIIGRKKYNVESPEGFPYHFSAIDVNGLILGPEKAEDAEISKQLTMRVKDVKSKKLMSKDKNYIVNIDNAVEESDFFEFTKTARYPIEQYDMVLAEITKGSTTHVKKLVIDDFEAMARASGLV